MTGPDAGTLAVWVVRSAATPDPAHLALLSAAERERCANFRQPERQARYACGRALLRLVLAERCAAADPAAFQIEPGANRRPELTGPSRSRWPDLDFNLSSTPGLVACAIGTGMRVGVDIEQPGRGADDDTLLARVTSAEERRWLAQGNAALRFCRLWTLKEAVAKADGEGLGIPFDQLTLLPDGQGGLRADLSALGAQTDEWCIYSLEATVPAALAARRDAPGAPALQLELAAPPAGGGFAAVPVTLRATGGSATAN